ncbi:hypothetical protein SCLCIDRAFT_10278 [Scleroderma citrinum Foug A]|uniref:Uncharacterized protein n=1 Tax=Scleroderma citrinum Foug A TaxID=1036808 RepID=A0A0C3DQM0_9AGAM|nr:hypothetical protein SCLCIDRAFT_10278 [Scleroderma citrinum Foug A]
MPCTKQTAKKSTGETANWISIPEPWEKARAADVLPVKPSIRIPPFRQPADKVAAKRTKILVPQEYRNTIRENGIHFQCVSCHWLLSQCQKVCKPYVGFTKDSAPILPTFLPVSGRFKLATCGHILSPSVLLIHFHLLLITSMFHVGIIYQSLADYFPHSSLDMLDVPFNLGMDEAATEYTRHAANLIEGLRQDYKYVLIVLTDHTDEDRRDLFVGANESGCIAAACIDNFLDNIFRPFKRFVSDSLMFIAVCGSIINQSESLNLLRDSLAKFQVSNALVTKSIVIHGFKFTSALEHVLKESMALGMHTGIMHFLLVAKYVWTHQDYQPWGQPLPMQCPQCGAVKKWKLVQHWDGSYSFECRYRHSHQMTVMVKNWMSMTTVQNALLVVPSANLGLRVAHLCDLSQGLPSRLRRVNPEAQLLRGVISLHFSEEPDLELLPALPIWAVWSWGETYLPEEIHTSAKAFQTALSQLKGFPWKSHKYGMHILLGLGLLIRDCWSVQELEEPEDGEQRTAPAYLYSSLLGVQKLEAVFVEVDVMSARLDQEPSSQTSVGEDKGGNEQVEESSKVVEESTPEGLNAEVGKWNEAAEKEEEKQGEEEKWKEEEKQQEEAKAEKRRLQDAAKEREAVEEERLGVQGKRKKCKIRSPSPVASASNPTKQDKLYSDEDSADLTVQ